MHLDETIIHDVVVRPQLSVGRADAQDAGEELFGREERRIFDIVGNRWELFSGKTDEISSDATRNTHSRWAMSVR